MGAQAGRLFHVTAAHPVVSTMISQDTATKCTQTAPAQGALLPSLASYRNWAAEISRAKVKMANPNIWVLILTFGQTYLPDAVMKAKAR
jgi:hypothetical protein